MTKITLGRCGRHS